MNNWKPAPNLEEKIRQSYQTPAIDRVFRQQLYQDLMEKANQKHKQNPARWRLKPAWAVLLVFFTIILLTALIFGPQKVYASVMRLFGYVPGVGIVEQQDMRILAEPASLTRDGVTVTVSRAVLTDAETKIIFGISGVPLSAYPRDEKVTGCSEHEYLRLPDGKTQGIDAPIPSGVAEATFILPCIFNTLPGKAPVAWEIPLRFIPAPEDYKILPVVEVTPLPTLTLPAIQATPTPSTTGVSLSIDKMIETADGYILIGYNHTDLPERYWLQISGAAVIHDALGRKVSYSHPMDIQLPGDSGPLQGGGSWAIQFKGKDVNFPITIQFSGYVQYPLDPQASVTTIIDTGEHPQPGQVWNYNHDMQLAGHTIRLVSVTAQSDGYSFQIEPGEGLDSVNVQIEGHQAIAGGGGKSFTSRTFETLPTGRLTLIFNDPIAVGPLMTWKATWAPEGSHEIVNAPNPGLCFDSQTIQNIPYIPDGLDGTVILTQLNPQRQIISALMNGTQQKVLATDVARSALSFDNTLLAYIGDNGITVLNLDNSETSTIPGTFGHDIRWSPDNHHLAVVNAGDQFGIFIIDKQTGAMNQLSNLGYEAIAGWSPDGSELFYAIPGSDNNGFQLRVVNMIGGQTREVFTLENSSRKAPMPALSPDGQWIAYRGADNSSLYIKGMDGSPAKLVLDNPAQAINGLVWEREGHLLGISLITEQARDGAVFLMAPDSCETYRLPDLTGSLDGIIIP